MFFKPQMPAAIDDFTDLAKCAAAQTVVIEEDVLLIANRHARAKAHRFFRVFAARLKPCPVTKRRLSRIPKLAFGTLVPAFNCRF